MLSDLKLQNLFKFDEEYKLLLDEVVKYNKVL